MGVTSKIMTRLGIVTGLVFEAQVLTGMARAAGCLDRVRIKASGPGRSRARDAANALLDEGVDMVLSMGLAGGLDPALRSGQVIVATAVRSAENRILPVSLDHHRQIMATLEQEGLNPVAGDLVEAVVPAASQGAKRALFRESRAVGVDMESFGVAKAANAAGVPFLALRVIADPADQEIPQAALLGMRPDGSVRVWPVLRGLMASPGMIPELLRLGRQSSAAQKVLGRLGQSVFTGFGLRG